MMTRDHSKRGPAFHNDQFRISRLGLLQALGYKAEFGDHRIPPGETGEWKDVWVSTGWDGTGRKVYLPRVILKPHGIANRLQAECPQCGKVMRFCGLQQHVGSKTCQEQATKDEVSGTFTHGGKTYSYHSEMADTEFGPENKVRIWEWGTDRYSGWLYQESASTKTVISWFKDMLDDIEEHKREEAADQERRRCEDMGRSVGSYQADAAPPFGLQEENR